MIQFNKKGMMEDLFDFLVFVALLAIILIFIGIFIQDSFTNAKEKSLGAIHGIQRADARVNSIKIALHQPELSIADLEKKMSDMGGLTIEECKDYLTKFDCHEDFARACLGAPCCTWNELQGVCS